MLQRLAALLLQATSFHGQGGGLHGPAGEKSMTTFQDILRFIEVISDYQGVNLGT